MLQIKRGWIAPSDTNGHNLSDRTAAIYAATQNDGSYSTASALSSARFELFGVVYKRATRSLASIGSRYCCILLLRVEDQRTQLAHCEFDVYVGKLRKAFPFWENTINICTISNTYYSFCIS